MGRVRLDLPLANRTMGCSRTAAARPLGVGTCARLRAHRVVQAQGICDGHEGQAVLPSATRWWCRPGFGDRGVSAWLGGEVGLGTNHRAAEMNSHGAGTMRPIVRDGGIKCVGRRNRAWGKKDQAAKLGIASLYAAAGEASLAK